MIPNIIADFRRKVSFAKSKEVDLFRNLASAIVSQSHSTFIDETHGGNVCNVSFTSVTGKPEKCEIADLLILSCATDGALRATFWQAKKQGKSKWLGVTAGNEHLDFNGQVNQWDLLCRRPKITGNGTFLPPPDLLSSFTSASIGSFGVFFQLGSNIEINHSVAEFVACHNPTAKYANMLINGYLRRYHYSADEIIVRPTLESFLEALFAQQVGALLNPAVSAHRWLVAYTRSKAAKAPGSNTDLRAFDRFLHDGPPIDLGMSGPGDGLSVLTIGGQNGA